MSITPHARQRADIPEPVRRDTVVMGRQGFFSVVLRLIGVEIYKLRCRTMSRVMSVIAILSVLIVFTMVGLSAALANSAPLSSYTHTIVGDIPASEALQAKQEVLTSITEPVRLPNALFTVTQIIDTVGLALIIILAGTIVGGEYGVGTIRLMFTRGPTRTQFILAKLGAMLTCALLCTIVLTILGLILGTFINLAFGINIDMHFLTGAWLLHALLYLALTVLNLFIYAVIAACLSTLGRTTAAGVAGTLIWWVLENILSGILYLLSTAFNQGFVGSFLRTIPDYFIYNNLSALQQNQHQYLLPDSTQPSQIPDARALAVIAVYLVLLIGITWWVNEKRDVTN
jgi:ABC-type transport system involved in multi-copper enzyme maturation permease subunit